VKPAHKRTKGRNHENATRDMLLEMGWSAKRMPLSGAVKGFESDVKVEGFGRIECKWEAKSFKRLYDLLEKDDNAGLSLKRDRDEPLFVCRLKDLEELYKSRLVHCDDPSRPNAYECQAEYGKECDEG
jgi:hypothetical protein